MLWEFYEYTGDALFGMNMQKTMLENGTPLVGHEAVSDTMSDLFVDFFGALIVSVIGYISLRYKKGWLNKFEFKRITSKKKKV
ncbi:hypothetical protein MFLO_04705 [Listeria floridensis FSL S10-1187]|uniref:Uncharacterized protein n=1 Tax=Listeria floridensis FSL S10-1187 TaxID=1265817 RepID=A0ABN0RHA6_9LIST|nr:hypothetical protein MFLO_04705 [Listeria floridensis FSL S10-1187]